MLKYFISIFFGLPIMLSSIISLYSIDYPDGFKTTPFILIVISLLIFFADFLLNRKHTRKYLIHTSLDKESLFLMTLLGYGIIFICFLDLFFHGVVLLNPDPTAYSTFTPFQHHLRHFSSLVWILAPVAFFINSKVNKTVFLVSAFLFPILFLDRNRLLFSVFSVSLTLLLFEVFVKNISLRFLISILVAFIGLFAFSHLGNIRSGAGAVSNTYSNNRYTQLEVLKLKDANIEANCNIPKVFPLNRKFSHMPSSLQWIFMYVSSPVFNLATQDFCHFRNTEILKSQIIPFYPKILIAENAIFVSPYLNVGTELLPFFTFGGWAFSTLIFLITFFILFTLIKILNKNFNIFTYLIFLRFGYCALFFNFAPQFYTWMSLGFVLIILVIKFSISNASKFGYALNGLLNENN